MAGLMQAAAGDDDEQRANGGDTLSLIEPIGKGGFGIVYRGRWRNMDVAVKVRGVTAK